MGSGGGAVVSAFLLFLLVAAVDVSSSAAAASGAGRLRGWKVGGRTVISDVRENEEVQDLGRFAVREHNRRRGAGGDHRLLVFGRVVRAERQVVSGIKYYLHIVAACSDQEAAAAAAAVVVSGSGHPFDAVVVVKTWLGSKQLLSFAPSYVFK